MENLADTKDQCRFQHSTDSDTESHGVGSIFSDSSTSTEATTAQTWGSTDGDASVSTDNGDDRDHNSANSSTSIDSDQQSDDQPQYSNPTSMDILPIPDTRSQLPCPFKWDGCEIQYDIQEKDKWKLHAYFDHLHPASPPIAVTCFFLGCGEIFCDEKNRDENWDKYMEHIAEHIVTSLNEFQDCLGGVTDAIDEGRFLNDLCADTEPDVNLRQYMICNGLATRVGLDKDIEPNPQSELDRIPRGFNNRMPLEYGGPRVREVVYGPCEQERSLDTRSADTMCVPSQRDGRRGQESSIFKAARTAENYRRPPHQGLTPTRRINGCRPGPSELILRL